MAKKPDPQSDLPSLGAPGLRALAALRLITLDRLSGENEADLAALSWPALFRHGAQCDETLEGGDDAGLTFAKA